MTDSDHNGHAQHERVATPNIKHERRFDKRSGIMVANQKARPEIIEFGSLKKVVGPATWKKAVEEPGMSARKAEYFHPPEDAEVSINVFTRGIAIPDDEAQAFANLLAGPEKAAIADEIKSIQVALGLSTVGDNQHTNSGQKGTRNYPVFNLTGANVVSLNGRKVLKVTGNFQNENGVPGTEFVGYFFASKADRQVIEELYYQAPTKGKFLRFANDFENSLKTVEWQ
jgi:hypothetical protein